MSTPDNHGKKAPQFAAFKPLTMNILNTSITDNNVYVKYLSFQLPE